MKTGTPARIDGRTIYFSKTTEHGVEDTFHKFSYLEYVSNKILKQMSCWVTRTNEKTHKILEAALPYSPLYDGQIVGLGPRYCPSVETKIVTFPDKLSHQIFLEPEGVDSWEYYINGFSSSLPYQIQIEGIRTIPGLKMLIFSAQDML